MEEFNVIHISDLHLSEHLLRGADKHYKLPHRYGHSVKAFLALDDFLRNSDWDLLIITGDISRIGNPESFEIARNWLENEITIGAAKVGLNLSKNDDKQYVIIPGNHDRFNGLLKQSSLDNYHHEFPAIQIGGVKSFYKNDIRVNVHLYDSTTESGGFAFGQIEEKALVPRTCSQDQINIAALHHHFIQPPKHLREPTTELLNSADVAAYLLNTGFDCIMFGHTHKGYIGSSSVEVLSGILNDKRTISRFWRRKIPKFFLRKLDNDCLVSYKRESAQNGQLPTLDSYFNFLFLRKKGYQVEGPKSFKTIKEFYHHIDSVIANTNLKGELKMLKANKILISLAPSACQEEAQWKGFHSIKFFRANNGKFESTWERYQYNGAKFKRMEPNEHVS